MNRKLVLLALVCAVGITRTDDVATRINGKVHVTHPIEYYPDEEATDSPGQFELLKVISNQQTGNYGGGRLDPLGWNAAKNSDFQHVSWKHDENRNKVDKVDWNYYLVPDNGKPNLPPKYPMRSTILPYNPGVTILPIADGNTPSNNPSVPEPLTTMTGALICCLLAAAHSIWRK
jgi:hypothetical protein